VRGARGLTNSRKLAVGVAVPPVEQLLFGVELNEHGAPVLTITLEQQNLIVIREEPTTMLGEQGEETLHIVAVEPAIVDGEVGEEMHRSAIG